MPTHDDADQAALPTAPFTLTRDQADETQLIKLAFEIANRAVIEDLESYAVKVQTDGRIWWDTRPMTNPHEHCAESIDMANEAIRYAVGAGLVGLHPQRPYLVTIHGRN
jgi:hypothetical protein